MKAPPSPSPSVKSETSLLEVEHLCFLENGPYSFRVSKGQCVGLTGSSGVGKTQLLRAITDLIPYTGSVRLKGKAAFAIPPFQWRKRVVMIPADSRWWYETVGPHFPEKKVTESMATFLDELGFDKDVMGWQVSRLSTGERQRLALLRGLLLQPEILLLDEPTSGLDKKYAEKVELIVSNYLQNQEAGVVWVGHDLLQLNRLTDKIHRVRKDRLETMSQLTLK